MIIRIKGNPVPQGSKTIGRHGNKSWIRDANAPKLKQWRNSVAYQTPLLLLDEPLSLTLMFYMPRGKTVTRKYPSVKPDIDKLVRAVLDGMTGRLFIDDSRIIDVIARKRYADDHNPGVVVEVERFSE